MEKIRKYKPKGESKTFDIDYDSKPNKIEEIISLLEDFKKNGATHVDFDAGYECDFLHFNPVYLDIESDEDFKKRKIKIQNRIKAEEKLQEQMERDLYEQLKAKYEN